MAVRGEDTVLDEVGVAVEGTTGNTVQSGVTVGVGGGVPDHDGAVTRRGDDSVGGLAGGSDGSDPAGVTDERSAGFENRHSVQRDHMRKTK